MDSHFQEFHRRGGRILQAVSSNLSLTSTPWLSDLDVVASEPSPFIPSYARMTESARSRHSDFDFALYDGSARWTRSRATDISVLATLGEPVFQRSADLYTSHGHSPVAAVTNYPVVVANSTVGAFAFPLGAGYHRHGYWIYAELFAEVLDRVLPARIISTDAPRSLELSVTYQKVHDAHPPRLLVRAVNFTAASRRAAHLEYFDYVVPLHNVSIVIRPGCTVTRIRAARSGDELTYSSLDGIITVIVPLIEQSEIIVMDLAEDL